MYRNTRLDFLRGESLPSEVSNKKTEGADHLTLKQEKEKDEIVGVCGRVFIGGGVDPTPRSKPRE